jgi:hypothetical protein
VVSEAAVEFPGAATVVFLLDQESPRAQHNLRVVVVAVDGWDA